MPALGDNARAWLRGAEGRPFDPRCRGRHEVRERRAAGSARLDGPGDRPRRQPRRDRTRRVDLDGRSRRPGGRRRTARPPGRSSGRRLRPLRARRRPRADSGSPTNSTSWVAEAARPGRRPSPAPSSDVVHDHRRPRVGERGDHPVAARRPAAGPGSPVSIRNGASAPGSAATYRNTSLQQGLVEVPLRQREHDGVDADPEPGAVETGLERAHQRGLARARGPVEHDHATGRHPVMMARSGRRAVAAAGRALPSAER